MAGIAQARWLGGAALAFAAVGTAQAQGTTEPPSTAAQAPGETTGSDIVVTAQRRAERLRDVPISITVQSAASLAAAGISNVRDLTAVTPGLNFTLQGAFAQPTIRGISSEVSLPGNESNVAIYLDGVFQASQPGNLFDLPDIERVEVLKGPQGTLFGRNAVGGAIQIITLAPSFTTKGKFSVSDGIYDGGANEYTAKGYLTGALTDTVAASVAGMYQMNQGYFHDILRDRRAGKIKSGVLRGKLLFKPADNVDVTATGFYIKKNDHAVFAGVNQRPSAEALALPFPDSKYDVANDVDGYSNVETYGGSLKAEAQFTAGTLTATTGYTATNVHILADFDGTAAPELYSQLSQPMRALSQEIVFSSRDFGPIRFTAGGFAYFNTERYDPIDIGASLASPPSIQIYSRSKTQAYAAFGEIYANLTDRLVANVGLRYSYEKRFYSGALADLNPLPLIGKASFKDLTPRLSLKYKLSDQANVYASYTEGFKSGLFDTTSFSPVPVKPEKVKAYEIGAKATIAGWVDLNLAAFHYDIQDRQVQTNVAGGVTAIRNAASTRMAGVEANVALRLDGGFRLQGGVSYQPTAKFVSYPNAAVILPNPVGGGGQNAVVDLSDTRLAKAPKTQATLLATYSHAFDRGMLDLSTNLVYSSAWFYELSRVIRQNDYVLINATAGWTFGDSGLKASVWAKNLTNKATIANYLSNGVGYNEVYAPPRQIGVTLELSF